MRPIIIYTLLLLLPSYLFSQSDLELGNGVITVNLEALPTLHFYSDTSSKTPIKTISVVKDKEQEFIIKDLKKNTWLNPEGIWLDYYIFTFRTTRKYGNW